MSRDAERTARALTLWHEARPAAGTIVQSYLATRGINLVELAAEAIASLRFHPRCPHPSGARLPAMMALVRHASRGPTSVHRTFLRADGTGKADVDPAKASLGPVGGGAVRLGLPSKDSWLAIAEGIETALSISVACGLPTWAALSAGGIKRLLLPPGTNIVLICADHDENGVGQRASRDAADRWLAEGRRVRVAMPPLGFDFNDVLLGRVTARMSEASDAT